MMPIVNISGPGNRLYVTAASGGDFQEGVYGPPSLYYDPESSTNGDGTLGNPYQYSQLAANVSAGDVVGMLPGFGELELSGDFDIPCFDPGVDGTSMSRVVYVGQYDPGTMGNPLTDGNRTQLGHDAGSTEANYRATIGWEQRDYVTFDSIVMDGEDGQPPQDTGFIFCHLATAPRAYRLWVQARTMEAPETLSNYCALWNTISTDLHMADCTLRGFRYTGSTSTNISALVLYSCMNGLFENLDIEDCNQALYVKGDEMGAGLNYLTFRRTRITDCGRIARFQACHATNPVEFYQNLATGIEETGLTLRNAGEGDYARNVYIFNNTFVFADTANGSLLSDGDAAILSENIQYFENIAVAGASFANHRSLGGGEIDFTRCRDNIDYRTSGAYAYSYDGSPYSSIGDYRTALTAVLPADAREENTINEDPVLDGNFEPDTGSPALDMGTASGLGGAGGPIGHTAGGDPVGRRT